MKFQEGKSHCASYGAKIVSIHSLEDQILIDDWMKNIYNDEYHHYWLGLHRDSPADEFKWEDESRDQFTNWVPGEPRASNKYAYVSFRPDRKWRTGADESYCYVVCELIEYVIKQFSNTPAKSSIETIRKGILTYYSNFSLFHNIII